MDQNKERGDLDTSGGHKIGPPILGRAFNFMVQFSNRFQSCVKVRIHSTPVSSWLILFFEKFSNIFYSQTQFKRSLRNDEGGNGNSALLIGEADSLWKLSLEKQLRTWRENPTWDIEKPEIKVTNSH